MENTGPTREINTRYDRFHGQRFGRTNTLRFAVMYSGVSGLYVAINQPSVVRSVSTARILIDRVSFETFSFAAAATRVPNTLPKTSFPTSRPKRGPCRRIIDAFPSRSGPNTCPPTHNAVVPGLGGAADKLRAKTPPTFRPGRTRPSAPRA